MNLVRRRRSAVEEGRLAVAPEAVALVRPLRVAHEGRQRALESRPASEVVTPEGDAPVFLQDRALQPPDEAVGPGMPRLGAGMANAQLAARLIECAIEFGPPVGQHSLHRPARPPGVRDQDLSEKARRGGGREGRQQPGQAVGRGGVARRDLPDLPHALAHGAACRPS